MKGNRGNQAEQPTDEKRREVLLKLGKVALYTPPALLTLMLSKRASADSHIGGGGPPPPPFP